MKAETTSRNLTIAVAVNLATSEDAEIAQLTFEGLAIMSAAKDTSESGFSNKMQL
jgi:hypothetical protein